MVDKLKAAIETYEAGIKQMGALTEQREVPITKQVMKNIGGIWGFVPFDEPTGATETKTIETRVGGLLRTGYYPKESLFVGTDAFARERYITENTADAALKDLGLPRIIQWYELKMSGQPMGLHTDENTASSARIYAHKDLITEIGIAYDLLRAKIAAGIGSTIEEVERSDYPMLHCSGYHLKNGEPIQLLVGTWSERGVAARFIAEQIKPEYKADVENLVAKMKQLYAALDVE